MPLDDYLLGLAFLVATVGGVGVAAWWLVRKRLVHLRGPARVLAFGLVMTLGLILVHLVPGAAGLLSRWSALAAAAVLLTAAGLLSPTTSPSTAARRRGRAAEASRSGEASDGRASRSLAVVGVALVAIAALGTIFTRGAAPVTNIDALTFHLPNVARWIQSGTLWQVDQFVPGLAHGNYPHNGDLVLTAAVLPWNNDAFARLYAYPFLAMLGLAVYATARELRSSTAPALLSGAAVASLPVVFEPAAFQIMTDTVMLATFAAGLFFLARHCRTGLRSDVVLAGIGLGMAFGTKWYGVTSVAVVLLVWAVAALHARRGARTVLGHGLALTGLVAFTGGFWLLRNLVESGNPVFPVKVSLLGITIFDAPRDRIREQVGFAIADYLDQPAVLVEYVLPDLLDRVGATGLVLAAGLALAAGIAAVARRRGHRVHRAVPWAVVAAVFLALAYAVTPTTALGLEDRPAQSGANVRYLAPALVVCGPILAWALSRLPRGRVLAEVLLLVGIAHATWTSASELAPLRLLAAAAVVVLLASLATTAWQHRHALRSLVRPRVAAPAVLVLSLVVAGAGFVGQRAFNDGRYGDLDPALTWIPDHARGGQRIGLAGSWGTALSPVWPAFGPDIRNRVEYVGELQSGLLQAHPTRESFLAALEQGSYDLLLIGLDSELAGDPPAERWARSAGFEEVVTGERFTLYRSPTGAGAGHSGYWALS